MTMIKIEGVAMRDLRDSRIIAENVFRHVTDDPVRCVAESEDLHWVFFGMDWREAVSDCDLMEDCYNCWPRCAYCFYTCSLDGECDRDEDDCPTHADWATVAARRVSGPPWFTWAYREVAQAMAATPWRPKPLRRWRPPLRPSTEDHVLYYPECLAFCHGLHMGHVWRGIHFIQFVNIPAYQRYNGRV